MGLSDKLKDENGNWEICVWRLRKRLQGTTLIVPCQNIFQHLSTNGNENTLIKSSARHYQGNRCLPVVLFWIWFPVRNCK